MYKLIFLFLMISLKGIGQGVSDIMAEVDQKNFFKAGELFEQHQHYLSKQDQLYISLILENAFNKNELSNQLANQLLSSHSELPDSIALRIYRIQSDNYIKLFNYRKAAETIQIILNSYSHILPAKETNDFLNVLKIWEALKDVTPQEVMVPATVRLKMYADKAGLKNLSISNGNDTIGFIFDTGANISTIIESTAQRLKMVDIPSEIEVGTITGQKVKASLAVAPSLKMGDVEIKNAVFLVLPDSALSFPQIDYTIKGILGFPVISAFREIQITSDNEFIIPEKETITGFPPNLALDGLQPVIYMNGFHFTFDTGASESMLYQNFYQHIKNEVIDNYPEARFRFGGAGGVKEFSGYSISYEFEILDKKAKLENLKLLKEKIKEDEKVYGNIGQDLITQFQKMTLNFERMFIKFD